MTFSPNATFCNFLKKDFGVLFFFFLQIVFLIGFGYIYVDIAHQCGTVMITVAPEGRPGHQINLNRYVKRWMEGHRKIVLCSHSAL